MKKAPLGNYPKDALAFDGSHDTPPKKDCQVPFLHFVNVLTS